MKAWDWMAVVCDRETLFDKIDVSGSKVNTDSFTRLNIFLLSDTFQYFRS